mgnify:CR=1 FL=1
MANRVVHFEIEASDLERAKKFYSEAFGWKLDQMGKEFGGYVVVTTGDVKEPGGINGGIFTPPPGGVKLNAYSCVVAVDDIDKAIEDVKKAGGEIIGEKLDIPTVGINVRCKDTEGNYYSIMQPSPAMPQKS